MEGRQAVGFLGVERFGRETEARESKFRAGGFQNRVSVWAFFLGCLGSVDGSRPDSLRFGALNWTGTLGGFGAQASYNPEPQNGTRKPRPRCLGIQAKPAKRKKAAPAEEGEEEPEKAHMCPSS